MDASHLSNYLFLILMVNSTAAQVMLPTFEHWYPDYTSLNERLAGQCNRLFTDYQNGECKLNSLSACKTELAPLVTNCLLAHILPIDTANQAAAGVMLGLLPTVLSLVGPTTIETGMLALRRPLLAQLMAASCPSISVIRTFDYRDGEEMLRVREAARPNEKSFVKSWPTTFMVSQYLLLLGCIGNLMHTVWELSRNTICTLSTQTAWLPLFWIMIALPIHWVGFVSVRMRVRLDNQRIARDNHNHVMEKQPSAWATMLKSEFRLGIDHPCDSGELKMRVEHWRFSILSWVASTGSVLHLIFGTIILSSTLFMTTRDGANVIGKLLLSVLVSRAILAGELYGMRCSIVVSKDVID